MPNRSPRGSDDATGPRSSVANKRRCAEFAHEREPEPRAASARYHSGTSPIVTPHITTPCHSLRTACSNPTPRTWVDFRSGRLLPAFPTKMIGPFIFFDHMGPVTLAPGGGVDVRPHPHIGLATVTYLFEGALMHRDSLGSVQRITPGDVNWMTAGDGIVHSERSPDDERPAGPRLHGIQTWVALPKAHEARGARVQAPPVRNAADDRAARRRDASDRRHGVRRSARRCRTYSEMFYIAVRIGGGSPRSSFHPSTRSARVYVVEGEVQRRRSARRAFPPCGDRCWRKRRDTCATRPPGSCCSAARRWTATASSGGTSSRARKS